MLRGEFTTNSFRPAQGLAIGAIFPAGSTSPQRSVRAASAASSCPAGRTPFLPLRYRARPQPFRGDRRHLAVVNDGLSIPAGRRKLRRTGLISGHAATVQVRAPAPFSHPPLSIPLTPDMAENAAASAGRDSGVATPTICRAAADFVVAPFLVALRLHPSPIFSRLFGSVVADKELRAGAFPSDGNPQSEGGNVGAR